MKVGIKDFGLDLHVKNRGMELEVRTPDGKHLGDLFITATKLIWCQGRTDRKNGKEITWNAFITMMNAK